MQNTSVYITYIINNNSFLSNLNQYLFFIKVSTVYLEYKLERRTNGLHKESELRKYKLNVDDKKKWIGRGLNPQRSARHKLKSDVEKTVVEPLVLCQYNYFIYVKLK